MSNDFINKLLKYLTPSVVLILCTILALICANLPCLSAAYSSLWSQPVGFYMGDFNFFSNKGHAITMGQLVNDFLMAIFFLSVGQEIKREIKEGELSTRKKALLPVIGACGGMLVPVLIFHFVCPDNTMMQRGMAIPMATDIAFSLGVLSVFGARVPLGLRMFLAALAVADDLGGIIVIALFYTSETSMLFLLLSALCIAVMLAGNIMNVYNKAFYLSAGLVLWYLMLNSGIHATIAGVILAFCMPSRLELPIGTFINYAILPLFAFANAGIDLSQMSAGDVFSGVSLAVMLGLVIGKFAGVFSFSWIAVRMGIVSLPTGATWKNFASVCMVCGIGFTVSMFIAELSYAGGEISQLQLLGQAKLGVLCGSIISAILGCILLNRTLPKREAIA